VLKKNGDFFFSISHPCFMTKGFGWVTDRQSNQEKLTVSGYFSKTQWVERWQFSQAPEEIRKEVPQFAIPRFPRTLADYINPLVQTGFILPAIVGNILIYRNGGMPVRCFYMCIARNLKNVF
jgi:hypothetical protein